MRATANIAVPTADSADNNSMRDVIGNKSDTHDGTSVRAVLHTLGEHAHKEQSVYPTGAAGSLVEGGTGAWTLGAFKEVVPNATIGSDFDIHWVNLEGVTAADTYELVLYAVEVEIARVRFTVLGTPANTILPEVRVQTPIITSGSQIQAKIMSASGDNDATISFEYHTY